MNLKELAKVAGVSPATISLVLNNKKGVGDDTRKRVLDILAQHNYITPARAKSVSKNIMFLKYKEHGMVVEDNADFITTILDSVENDCRQKGYNLSIFTSEHNLEETLQKIDYGNYHGMVLLGTELDSNSYPLLEKIPIPYIVVDNIIPDFPCNSIAINNQEIVSQAVRYLASLGHDHIAYFRSSISIQNFDERNEAFRDAVRKNSLAFDPSDEFVLTPTLLGAYRDMKKYLQEGRKLPACAFADNDTIAIGTIKALKEFGIKVPRDISVIGIDDIHFSAINSPSITTINIYKKLIGSLVLRNLQNMFEDPDFHYVKTRVGGELVVRESTRLNTP